MIPRLFAALILLGAVPAYAVIEVKETVSKLVDLSRSVSTATITKLTADTSVVEAKIDDAIKGQPPAPAVTITAAAPADLFPTLKLGDRVVIMQAKAAGVAVLHLGNRWLIAGSAAASFTLRGPLDDKRGTFPGTTAALTQILAEIKAGKSTLLNALGPRTLNGEERKLATLPGIAKPTSFAAADVNADGLPDLLICAANKPHLFIATKNGYEDQTEKWGLKDLAADHVDLTPPLDEFFAAIRPTSTTTTPAAATFPPPGRSGLLIGKTLYINTGATFVPMESLINNFQDIATSQVAVPPGVILTHERDITVHSHRLPAPSNALASVTGQFGEDAAFYTIAVTPTGLLRMPIPNSPLTTQNSPSTQDSPLKTQDSSSADDLRLTGASITQYHPDHKKNGFQKSQNIQLTPIDANGDGRPDLLLTSSAGNLLLLNRGFGAFLVDPDAAKALTHPGLLAAAPLTPNSKQRSLLILTADGTLYALDSKP